METVLSRRWLDGCASERTLDEASIAVARDRVREEAAAIGLSVEAAASLATATSELGHNQLRHGRDGRIGVRRVTRLGVAGVEVIAADCGDGFASVESIVAPARATPGASLGIGLSGVIALCDEVDFDVRISEGTCVWARKFVAPIRPRVVALCGRPIEGERIAGDDATFVRFDDGTLVIALADGLGHGAEARDAANRAIACVVARPERAPNELLDDVHIALAKTRGAVMAIARLGPSGALDVAISGNVCVRSVGRNAGVDRRYAGPSFALGMPGNGPRMRSEHDALGPHEMLVAFSDGVRSRLAVDASLFGVPPIVAARRLLDLYSDQRDDALIALVK